MLHHPQHPWANISVLRIIVRWSKIAMMMSVNICWLSWMTLWTSPSVNSSFWVAEFQLCWLIGLPEWPHFGRDHTAQKHEVCNTRTHFVLLQLMLNGPNIHKATNTTGLDRLVICVYSSVSFSHKLKTLCRVCQQSSSYGQPYKLDNLTCKNKEWVYRLLEPALKTFDWTPSCQVNIYKGTTNQSHCHILCS